jgi:hypothetical protein
MTSDALAVHVPKFPCWEKHIISILENESLFHHPWETQVGMNNGAHTSEHEECMNYAPHEWHGSMTARDDVVRSSRTLPPHRIQETP